MARVTKDTATRVEEITGAWQKMRPAKSFYGMKLEDFRNAVKPFTDARKEIADLEIQLQHAISKRETANPEATKVVQGIINAVKGDPEEGEDGELYSAMGYVPKSLRGTGLKRPRKEGPAKGDAA